MSLLDRWSGGTGEIRLDFSKGSWRVLRSGHEIATLSELPDFEEWLTALDAVARREGSERHDVSLPGSLGEWANRSPREIFDALTGLDDRGDSIAAAVRPYLFLSLAHYDALGVGDDIPARAIAALAWAHARSPERVARETVLLAAFLGYSEAARRLSEPLAEDDPVRAFGRRDHDALHKRSSDQLGRLLLLYLLARQDDFAGWIGLVRSQFRGHTASVPVLTSAFRLTGLEPKALLPALGPHIVLVLLLDDKSDSELVDALERSTRAGQEAAVVLAVMAQRLQVQAAGLADRFEASLAERMKSTRPGLGGPDVQRAFYQSLFYSALHAQARYLLDSLAAESATAAYQAGFHGVQAPLGKALETWLGDLLPDPSKSRERVSARKQDAIGDSPFGLTPRLRSYEALKITEPYRSSEDRRVIQAILQHGDSRPWHIRELFPLIEESLEDLDLEERWLAYLDHAAAADSAYWVGRLRYMRRDRDGILRLLSAERLVPKQSLRLIYQLQRLVGDESPFVETALRKQITTFPGSYHLNRDLAILLRNRGRYDDARAVIEKWLALSLPDPGLERSFAYTELAKIRLKEGKLKEALSLAERAVQSGAAYPWFVQVQILEALKRDDEADSQLRALLARYPDSWGGTAWLAEILWRRGKSKEAAEFLQSAQRGRHFGAWKSQIAPGFTRVFTKRPVEDVVAAISALQSAGFISTYFEILAQAFEKREQWAPANAIRQSFLKQKTADPRALLSAFRSEQALHGSTAAAEWAARNTQRNATLSAAAAAEGELELPWLLPEETNPALAPSFWLTRAMVWLDAGCAEGERHDRLRAWAREPRGKGYEALIRHIAGDSTLDELWRSSADVPGKTYAAGLRALAEGRAPEASQWFRITVELDSEEFADRAERRLTLLRRRGESLSRIPALCGKSVARSDS